MIPKTKSATVFRKDLYDTLKEVSEGSIYLVTQKQGDNVVLIAQEQYNKILSEREVLRAISAGVADIETGKTHAHKAAVSRLRKLQSRWK